MKPSEQRWPAQQAPHDFPDRVVQAGLDAMRPTLAEFEPPYRRSPRRIIGRAALGWSLAAALAVGAFALQLAKTKPNAEAAKSVEATQLVEAQKEVARQAREVAELRAAVARLEEDRVQDRQRAELKAKLAEVQRPAKGAAVKARPATSRPACDCQPGDALCSCL